MIEDRPIPEELPTELGEMLAWTATEELVDGIAHDLGNALGAILNNAMFLAETLPANTVAGADVAGIVESAREATALTRQLGLLGRSGPTGRRVVDVGALVVEFESLLRRGLADWALRVVIDDGVHTARVDPGALARAMIAVVLARREELYKGAMLELGVRTDAACRCVRVIVHGPALGFDPLRGGARGLAAAAGGRLTMVQAPAGFAALSITLPIDDG